MLAELRERLLGLGYQFAVSEVEGTGEIGEAGGVYEAGEIGEAGGNSEAAETAQAEACALRLALRRALSYAQNICSLPELAGFSGEVGSIGEEVRWPAAWPTILREPVLDLAAAYFLQARLALSPEELAVMPVVTSLRLGDAALGFAGGSQKTGTDALSRAESLCNYLLQTARSAFCGWRGILW